MTGVVLCGGKSQRMGKDKALIIYHQKPQYLHVVNLLNPFCNKVVMSCNSKQVNVLSKEVELIEDDISYADSGPMGGVLSVVKKYPNQALFVVGCDYPFLTNNDLQLLQTHRGAPTDAVCFINPETGFKEPLIAIYETSCFTKMQKAFNSKKTSLRYFLDEIHTKAIVPDSLKNIQSVDY